MTLIDILEYLILQINRWICPCILIFGILGNIFNLIIFTRQTFLKQSCSLYFLSIALINLAMYLIGLTTRIIDDGWKLNLIFNTTNIYCKIRNYLVYTLFSISSWLFVLASLDRYFATNQSAIKRQFYCSYRTAFKLISLTIFICVFVHIHMLIFYGYYLNLDAYNQLTLTCTSNSLAYSVFYAFFILIFYSFLPPILMSIMSLLTINNIRKSRRRTNILTVLTLSKIVQTRRDTNQLIKILSLQIFILILFTIPHSIYWLYIAFTALDRKSNLQREYEKFALNIVRILLYINYGSSFYIQIIISRTFRLEFIKFLKKIFRRYLYIYSNQ
jgi:hypothetical protein